jgi:hypothetical protein
MHTVRQVGDDTFEVIFVIPASGGAQPGYWLPVAEAASAQEAAAIASYLNGGVAPKGGKPLTLTFSGTATAIE